MEFIDIFKIIASVLLSIGGGGVIILLLSGYLGKIWANRIMANEKAEHEKRLAELRADLEKANDTELSKIKNELDIFKEKHIKGHSDKIDIYRAVVDIIGNFIADLDVISQSQEVPGDLPKRIDQFNRERMRVYGYLAMLAPQNVLDSYDNLIEYIFEVLEGKNVYEFTEVRRRALVMLNTVRVDVGIGDAQVTYNGNR